MQPACSVTHEMRADIIHVHIAHRCALMSPHADCICCKLLCLHLIVRYSVYTLLHATLASLHADAVARL